MASRGSGVTVRISNDFGVRADFTFLVDVMALSIEAFSFEGGIA